MIDASYFWTNIFLMAVGTLIIRVSIIGLSAKVKITQRHREIFGFIPSAILPALAIPMVFFHQGVAAWLFGKERFFILILATVVAYYGRKMTLTLTFGLVTLYLVTHFAA